jgi:hypothetical protein
VGVSCSTYGELRNVYKFLVKMLEGKTLSEDLGVDGRRLLKLFLGKENWRVSVGFARSGW